MNGKKMLPIALVAFLIAALVIPAVVWVSMPPVRDLKGTLARGFSSGQWRLISWKEKAVPLYSLRNPEVLARWIDCDRCLYDADIRVRIFSQKKMSGSDSVSYDAEIVHIWNIKREPQFEVCPHKK